MAIYIGYYIFSTVLLQIATAIVRMQTLQDKALEILTPNTLEEDYFKTLDGCQSVKSYSRYMYYSLLVIVNMYCIISSMHCQLYCVWP